MFSVSASAAEQILISAKQGQMENLPLRIAAKRKENGEIQYAMGFDDQQDGNDLSFTSEGVKIVIAPACIELLKGATLDYVELEPGQYNFIFLNPNDPNFVAPEDAKES